MGKKVYIDGNFLLKSGVFYGLNFTLYADEKSKDLADEIVTCNDEGVFEVIEDGGSMFTTYFVKGGITMYGGNGSGVVFFRKEHEHTYVKYKEIQTKIIQLLEEAIVPEDCKNYFYQQQYVSLLANLEYFLYGTFMWETCQCYESYKKIIDLFATDKFKFNKRIKLIFSGEHNILQETTFLEQTKYIIYHNKEQVKTIFDTAFNINVDLSVLDYEIGMRQNIVHRAGYTTGYLPIQITKENVIALNNKIETLVEQITKDIAIFKGSKCADFHQK